jgi:hypothetical protein
MTTHVSSDARRLARAAVQGLVALEGPPGGGSWFRHPGLLVQGDEPPPLACLDAARALGTAMHGLVIEHALRARGAGEGWDEVAVALGLVDEDRPDCMAAYLAVLGVRADDPWWSPARGVSWTCASCGARVRDFGPECGGPDDRETGHEPTCSRHRSELAAWEAMWR